MRLTVKDFEACLNQPFRIRYGADQELTVTLTGISPWGSPTPENQPDYYQPFAVMFQSGIAEYLTQATYRIANDRLGEHDIFIVPLGPNTQGMRYEAVFS